MTSAWEGFLDLAVQLAAPPPPSVPQGDQTADPREPAATDIPSGSAPPPANGAQAPSEAALRTAVSRAYYAAYHFARDYLENTRRIVYDRVESHRAVWEAFNRGGRETKIKLDGFDLLKERKVADYDDDLPSATTGPRGAGAPTRKAVPWQARADLAIRRAHGIQTLLRDLQRKK